MNLPALPYVAGLKLDLLFDGVRYSHALGQAIDHSFPNFYPYRFQEGENNPTGKTKVPIPYLFTTQDGTLIRIKGNGSSPWVINGSLDSGYTLLNDDQPGKEQKIQFEPLPKWMQQQTLDGFPMANTGVSLHGDMAVVNVAPGCDYFLEKHNGESMRCAFCAYGAPDERTTHLGQKPGQVSLPAATYKRMQETLSAAIEETTINHIYLVGGSMRDWHDEGERFIELAQAVQAINKKNIPVTCGSGAIPADIQKHLFQRSLVDSVCFNLEVWPESLFAKVCPGKNKFVGFDRWLESLETAVSLWGKGRVYSAMVAGIELEPEHNMSWESAVELAIKGAEDLCRRGVIPIYSLYWPVGGRDHPDYFNRLRLYFEKLNLAYAAIREQYGLQIWDGFMCHRCAYMQLECDIDREVREG
jgi:hypothetical protein